jgi:NTE family protein
VRIGLALGGGGMRGATHIGVLEALLANGIKPNIIVGASAGSVVASLYALGYSIEDMIKVSLKLPNISDADISFSNKEKIIPMKLSLNSPKKTSFLPLGLVNSDKLSNYLFEAMGYAIFEQCKIPLAVVATDLYTTQGIIYTSRMNSLCLNENTQFIPCYQQLVSKAVTASCAIPGVFTPVVIQDRTLIDGGLISNVPADIVSAMGADFVIAVDLLFDIEQDAPFKNMFEILIHTYDIMGQRISNMIIAKYADFTIIPKKISASLKEYHKIPLLIEQGRKSTEEIIPQLLTKLESKKKRLENLADPKI